MKVIVVLLTTFLISHTIVTGQPYSFENYKAHCDQLKYADIDDFKLAYLDEGKGPAIILVHGIPTNSWLYRKMINPLVSDGFRVIVPDMMGAGQSSKPRDSKFLSFEAQSHYLGSLLGQLDIKSCCLVVHDAGGPWSWNMLNQKNHPVKNIVLLNTILYEEGFSPPFKLKNNGLYHRILRWAYGNSIISKFIIKSTLKNGMDMAQLNNNEEEGYIKGMSKSGKQLAGAFFGSFRKIDEVTTIGQEALQRQKIPLLACWGQNDKILKANLQMPLIMRDLNLQPKDAHLIAMCNHYVQEEAPEILTAYITQFLSQHK